MTLCHILPGRRGWVNRIMTNEHTSLEKYTSHTLFERVVCERWVRDWTDCDILTPAALLSHSTGLLNRGSWGPKPSAGTWFSLPQTVTRTPTNWLQLTRTVCGTRLYNCLTPTRLYNCLTPTCIRTEFNPSTCQGDIFDRMHLFLDWRLGRRSICYNNTTDDLL